MYNIASCLRGGRLGFAPGAAVGGPRAQPYSNSVLSAVVTKTIWAKVRTTVAANTLLYIFAALPLPISRIKMYPYMLYLRIIIIL